MLDVGGGAGLYAVELLRRGYEVRLVDPIPLHVEQARAAGVDAELGDARALDDEDSSCDAVLVLGPLYHLTERRDRVAALTEARRVVRPDGVVLAAAISRFASLVDGVLHDRLGDPSFREIVESDLAEGQHRNPECRRSWFTTAFFHHPDELRGELDEAGLIVEAVLAVEGLAGLRNGLPADEAERRWLLETVRRLEAEPRLLGLSSHLLAVGRRR